MTKTILKQLPVFFSVLLLSACNVINPEEDIPAFVHIDSFNFSTNTFEQGSASEKITDVYFYVDGDLLGGFELPATIPVLATGTQDIVAIPGIRENGIKALPGVYPFYTQYMAQVDLEAGRIDTIKPTTFYQSNVKFRFSPEENFEGNTNVFLNDLDGNDQTKIVPSTVDIFEGIASGRIHLDQTNTTVEAGSFLFVDYPEGVFSAYLEMDYKTEVEMIVGIIGYNNLGQRIYTSFERGVNQNSEWTKIYFNFSDDMQVMSASTSQIVAYQLCFHARLRPDQTEADIFLDNVKWVHF